MTNPVNARRDDAGFTLVELLVTTALLGIVLSLATVGYVTGLRVADDNNARTEAANEAATALEVIGRGLRTAARDPGTTNESALEVAEPDKVRFSSSLYTSSPESARLTISYEIDEAGSLIQTTEGDGRTHRRILAHSVRNHALFRFFRCKFYNGDGDEIQAPVTPDELGEIRVIDTTVSVHARERVAAPSVTARTSTFLVNADYEIADNDQNADDGDSKC